jgi:hypothetical protein
MSNQLRNEDHTQLNTAIQRAENLLLLRQKIVNMSPEKALETILDSAHSVPLIHSFPEEDFYFLINSIGEQDSLPILSMASDRQLEYVLDMEIWEKDLINQEALHKCMKLFFQADPIRMTKWLIEKQPHFTQYYLFKNIQVTIREHDQDPSDFHDDFFTLDNVFYCRIIDHPPDNGTDSGNAEEKHDFLKEFISRVADNDHIKYQELLLRAVWIIPAEFEEISYRLKNVRLAEKGFLPFEQAIGIYQPLTTKDFKKKTPKTWFSDQDSILPVPLYLSGILKQENLFVKALALINTEQTINRLVIEFAGLCNQLAVADQKTFRNKNQLKETVRKAGAYISIGLERLANQKKQSTQQNALLIQKYMLSDIFRLGYGLAMKLKWQAQKWRKKSWFAKQKLPLTFWGEEWVGILGGLLIKRPLFFDNYKTTTHIYTEFTSLDQIQKTKTALDTIIYFDTLLSKIDINLSKIILKYRLVTHKSFILTLWAREYLRLDHKFSPLTIEQLRTFFNYFRKDQTTDKKISSNIKETFLTWLSDKTKTPDHEISRQLGQALEDIFTQIEDEYKDVSSHDLDPRYVHLFLVR